MSNLVLIYTIIIVVITFNSLLGICNSDVNVEFDSFGSYKLSENGDKILFDESNIPIWQEGYQFKNIDNYFELKNDISFDKDTTIYSFQVGFYTTCVIRKYSIRLI